MWSGSVRPGKLRLGEVRCAMDFVYKLKPKPDKCRVCKKVMRDIQRTITLTVKGNSEGVHIVRICDKCLYKLPSDLIKDILNPNLNANSIFCNKILSALLTNKYRELYRGYVALIKIPHIRDIDIDLGCSYRFTKNSEDKLNIIDSSYFDGRKIKKE